MNLNKLLINSLSCLLLFACEKDNKSKKITKHRETNHLLDNEYLIRGQAFNESTKSIYLFNVSHLLSL